MNRMDEQHEKSVEWKSTIRLRIGWMNSMKRVLNGRVPSEEQVRMIVRDKANGEQ